MTTFDTFQRYADRSEAPKNAFYSKMRTGIYNVCEETLRTGGLHIIALNPGVGKTQFTNAYLGAMIEDDPAASALVVVEQIATVQERFETLYKLIPGKVACWTTRFKTVERDKLYQYPIACITHAAFMTADDRLDATARIDGHNRIDHLDDDAVREVLPRLAWFNTTKADRYSKNFEKAEYVGEIIGFARTMMNRCAFLSSNGNEVQMIGYRNDLRITGPTLQLDATSLIDGVKQLGLTGRNYHTAASMGVPPVTYGSLRCIIRKPPLQKGQRIANIAKRDDAATRYRDWMVETVKNPEYLQPGQKALVVTKKAFTIEDGKYLPDWKRDSERPKEAEWVGDPDVYVKLLQRWNDDQEKWEALAKDRDGFHWDLGQGRSAAVTYFGANTTGSNAWNAAETVFIFEADYPKQGPNTAEVQAWLNLHTLHREGVLAEMPTIDTYNNRVDAYRTGRLVGSHAQLIPRGLCRKFDEHGRCSPMLVVCGISDADWLLENWTTMFPGAPPPVQPDASSRTGTYRDRVKAYLHDLPTSVAEVSAEQVAAHLGPKAWRDVLARIMTRRFRQVTLPALGWSVEVRGRGRSKATWFVRAQPLREESIGVMTAESSSTISTA
jgi:hypothetical protein